MVPKLETRLYSGWEFQLGERELSQAMQELYERISPLNTRPFYDFLRDNEPIIKGVLSLYKRRNGIRPIALKFAKLPQDYYLEKWETPGKPHNEGWRHQDSAQLPDKTIKNLAQDFSQVIEELGLLPKDQRVRFCSVVKRTVHPSFYGFFWIDDGKIVFDDADVLFEIPKGGYSYLTPAAFPLSTIYKDQKTHLGNTHIDDIICAYAANLNQGVMNIQLDGK